MTITSKAQLQRCISEAEMAGSRLQAGSQFAGKGERHHLGVLLQELAGVTRRCFDVDSARAWHRALPEDAG